MNGKILLIRPKIDRAKIALPNGLLYLASYLKKFNYNVVVKDLNCVQVSDILEQIKYNEFKIVGISMLFYSRKESYNLIKTIKSINNDIKIIIGGLHLTFLPKLLVDKFPIDAVVIGEGELTLKELADFWIRGKGNLKEIRGIVTKSYGIHKPRGLIKNIDGLPIPDYSQVNFEQYDGCGSIRAKSNSVINGIKINEVKFANIITSRGCSWRCNFCNAYKLWGYKVRFRSAENVLEEIRRLYNKGVRLFNIDDDSFAQNKEIAIRICKGIIRDKMKIAWAVLMKVDNVDEELLFWMRKSGCYIISYGIESGSDKILRNTGKMITKKTIKETIHLTKKAGIKTIILIMIGNTGETDGTIKETIHLMKELKADYYSSVGSIWALPGTSYYNVMEERRAIDNDYWVKGEDGTPIFLDNFTVQDLQRWRKMMNDEICFMGSSPKPKNI